MNTKLINTRSVVMGLALLTFNVGSVWASSITLNGVAGNSCDYSIVSVDSSGNLTATCVVTSPTLTPTCSLVASPSTISAGSGSISTLTASCSPAATSYAWTGVGTTNFTSGGTVTPTATTTYTVRGANGDGSGNTASATVTVTTTPPPSTGGGGQAPTSSSPLAEIKRWNYAFETVNKYPFHDSKQSPVAYMAYNKLIQSNKPTIIFLPTSW